MILYNNITGEFFNVEIVEEDSLPSGCEFVSRAWDLSNNGYAVYKNCVDKLYYAILEEM